MIPATEFAIRERIAQIHSRQQEIDRLPGDVDAYLSAKMYGFLSMQTVTAMELLAGLDFEQLVDAKLAAEREKLADELSDLEYELQQREDV